MTRRTLFGEDAGPGCEASPTLTDIRPHCQSTIFGTTVITDPSCKELRLHVDASRERPAEVIEDGPCFERMQAVQNSEWLRRNGCRTVQQISGTHGCWDRPSERNFPVHEARIDRGSKKPVWDSEWRGP